MLVSKSTDGVFDFIRECRKWLMSVERKKERKKKKRK